MRISRELWLVVQRNLLFLVTFGSILVAFVTGAYGISKIDDQRQIPYLIEHDVDNSSKFLTLLTSPNIQITKDLVVSSLKTFISRVRTIPAELDLLTIAHRDAKYQTSQQMYLKILTSYLDEVKPLKNFHHPTVDLQFISFVLLRPNTWLAKWNEIYAHNGLLFNEKQLNGVFVLTPYQARNPTEVKNNPWPFKITNFYISETRT